MLSTAASHDPRPKAAGRLTAKNRRFIIEHGRLFLDGRHLPAAEHVFQMPYRRECDIFTPRARRYLNVDRQSFWRRADANGGTRPASQIVHLHVAGAPQLFLVESRAV